MSRCRLIPMFTVTNTQTMDIHRETASTFRRKKLSIYFQGQIAGNRQHTSKNECILRHCILVF